MQPPRHARHVLPLQRTGHAQRSRELPDEGRVRVSFCAPKPVIEMGGVEFEIKFLPESGERVQQRAGILPARHGRQDGFAGRDGAGLPEEVSDGGMKRIGHSER